jgi:hypothetical protein
MSQETRLEGEILEALLTRFKSRPGNPFMTFSELYETVGVSESDIGKAWYVFYSMQSKGLIDQVSLDNGLGGTAKITPRGIKVAQDRQRTLSHTKTAVEDSAQSCPANLEKLIQTDEECARLIRRDELVNELVDRIQEYPDKKVMNPNYIVLYGQPMTGKTKVLYRLAEVLDNDYVPLIVTVQGSSLTGLNYFAFDLASQLTNKFNAWAQRYGIPSALNSPTWEDFREGMEEGAFRTHWRSLRRMAGQKQPIVMFDEVERLLDSIYALDEKIIDFISDFVKNPDNGYFVLVGSERVHWSESPRFSLLIGNGDRLLVRYLGKEATLRVFSAAQSYFTLEPGALEAILMLCDGHPRILQHAYEVIVSTAMRSRESRKILASDVKPIAVSVVERIDDILWALLQRLSEEERRVVELFSHNECDLRNALEYDLKELHNLAEQHAVKLSTDSDQPNWLKTGIRDLKDREWVEGENGNGGLFRFKLGIVPWWYRYRHVDLGYKG